MAYDEHLKILQQGVAVWNKWREEEKVLWPYLSGANLSEADLVGANLAYVNLSYASLARTDLSHITLRGANLSNANLRNANLTWADLRETDLREANLHNANLSGAKLSGVENISFNAIGLPLYGSEKTEYEDYLLKDYLDKVQFEGANLSSADLGGANLTNADLRLTNLHMANLEKAELNYADMSGAKIDQAVLKGASLKEAQLNEANFSWADLHDVDFSKATCNKTLFVNVDLSTCKGLDTITHNGRSSIGIDTLYMSHGKIPEVFLKGCGVPDTMIVFTQSLVGKAIDYYSCFISYSTADEDFANLLYNTLQGAGIRCWYAPEQLLPGTRIDKGIDRGIRYWDKVLFCASKSSLTEKWWVDFEVDKAFAKEQNLQRKRAQKVDVLIPLNLDGYLFSDEYQEHPRASQFRTTLAEDFVGWKQDIDKFNQKVKRVIRALQTDSGLEELPESKL